MRSLAKTGFAAGRSYRRGSTRPMGIQSRSERRNLDDLAQARESATLLAGISRAFMNSKGLEGYLDVEERESRKIEGQTLRALVSYILKEPVPFLAGCGVLLVGT